MGRYDSVKGAVFFLLSSIVLFLPLTVFTQQTHAVTASIGQPYHGRLLNGIPFPTQFPGYHVRDESHTYTTPEVIGALLDGIEAVRTEFPDTCDLYIGDFSGPGGGASLHHRSHQNGRDVDVGMFAKGNRPLDTLTVMNEQNLDAPKTWCLIENIIRSQRVQYIFLDISVQKILYNYALTKGYDQAYLDRVFGNCRGALLQHVRNHIDHFHVRFFTPWSTLAAHIGDSEDQKRMVIDMAQQAYLPKKVNYYVNGSEKGLDALAQSFGVTRRDVCKWNHISPNSVLTPGSCLVFYKRSFEIEPVHLAQSLQPGFIAQAPAIRTASLRSTVPEVSDAQESAPEPQVKQERDEPAPSPTRSHSTISARRGDTLEKIAKRSHINVNILCQLNHMKRTAALKPGQTVRLASASQKTGSGRTSNISFGSEKPNEPTIAYYTAAKGDTLPKIAKKSGIPINSLCQMNGLKRNSAVKPGQKIKLTQATMPSKSSAGSVQQKTAAPAQSAAPSPCVSKARSAVVAASSKPAAKTAAPAKGVKAAKPAAVSKQAKVDSSKQAASKGASKVASKAVKQPQAPSSKPAAKVAAAKGQKAPDGSAKAAPAKPAAKAAASKTSAPARKNTQDAKAVKAKPAAPQKATSAKKQPAKEATAKLAKK